MDNKIGYMINESGIIMEDFEIIDSSYKPATQRMSENFKFHSPDRVIGYGVLQTAEERNRNGRIYTRDDLEREINAPRQIELLSSGNLLAEASHPLSTELVRQQTIDPRNTCARFHKLWLEGNNVMAYFEGTNNDLGNTFDKDLRMGIKPAFSLRALGTIKSTPRGAVVENLKMITYDYVIYPSHPHAYTHGVLNENASLEGEYTSNFALTEANDATKSFIKEFTNADVVDAISKVQTEAAIDYIKDKSFNFKMLKECYDMTKFDTIDIISTSKVALTEAGNATIIMNVEDYIAKELQNYTR